MTILFGLDVGSNSLGSAWIDDETGEIVAGLSIFPAGVDEADDKRGEPKNVKRRQTRRTRVTLARRAARKRQLRLRLIQSGLLPTTADEFQRLLEGTDPWELRRKGLTEPLTPHEFGRALLHLAQRRGAVGFDAEVGDQGKVKAAMSHLQQQMLARYGTNADTAALCERIETLAAKKRRTEAEDAEFEAGQNEIKARGTALLQDSAITFGRFIADLRDQDDMRKALTSEDRRKEKRGPREWREPVRNRAGQFLFHAHRGMIRDEFAKLWDAQKRLGGPVAALLTDELRKTLDDETADSTWRNRGVLFGQRRATWDLGMLGRCVLHASDRCVPHADRDASRYLVVEFVNNLRVLELGKPERPLSPEERTKILTYLSGPLGTVERKGKTQIKRTVSATDLRELMGWGRATKTTPFRFNIENDEGRVINTDWFNREIVHGGVTIDKWSAMTEQLRESINKAILKFDPDEEADADKMKKAMTSWAGLNEEQANAVVEAWRKRPRIDAKRLKMSRRAVRNVLSLMDHPDPSPDEKHRSPTGYTWLTQVEARLQIARDKDFIDLTTGEKLDEHTRRRYATGTKGATARDRHYMKKHPLLKNGEPVVAPDGELLAEPAPAPLISNPVVRKAIHEVRRHLVAFLREMGQKPDAICVELAREAKMGKKESDELLFRNRLRNRIRNAIVQEFDLGRKTSTQQRAAVDRVILCVQQGGVCPLCGNQLVTTTITPRLAANGDGCEVSHILPRASGGHNGLSNLVLAHTKCNREMKRQTPREYWNSLPGLDFDKGIRWVEGIYAEVSRPKFGEVKSATGEPLWKCYFDWKDDRRKIAQFKKDIRDIKEMTEGQGAATKYAARQIMGYLADSLFGGAGLPEGGGTRRVFATDGLWTSRLRKEWELFFDPHDARVKNLASEEKHARKEKDRGDHRHHAIDAVIIALTTAQVRNAWDAREKAAEAAGIDVSNEEAMKDYRERHRLPPPKPFASLEQFRDAVKRAVYGGGPVERPVCHRPVKRKLIGALHEETLFGPVIEDGKVANSFTARKGVLLLKPNHLRMPRPEKKNESIDRIAERLQKTEKVDEKTAVKRAKAIVASPGFTPKLVDPPPEKSGLVRDLALRKRIRDCLSEFRYCKRNSSGEPVGDARPIDPDDFTPNEIKQAFESGAIRHASGVPIRTVVLLRSMSDAVIVDRRRIDYATGKSVRDENPAAKRAYVGGNNHHIEIRVATDKKGKATWFGDIVTAFDASKRKLAKLRAMRAAGIPNGKELRKLPKAERARFAALLQEIERKHPIVDRSDNESGKFVMSICEGETLYMRRKSKNGESDEIGYFVVAKLDKPQSIVVVPHWDARAAGERKDSEGKTIPNSEREQFAVTPGDLKKLAPPDHPHAVKVRVGPLGDVRVLTRD